MTSFFNYYKIDEFLEITINLNKNKLNDNLFETKLLIATLMLFADLCYKQIKLKYIKYYY